MRPKPDTTIYFLRPIGQEGPVKIGSTSDPDGRLITYISWSPVPLEIAAQLTGPRSLELRFHALFQEQHTHHEWFSASDALTQAIDQIRAGRFDLDSLPAPKCLTGGGACDQETRLAIGATNRLTRLKQRGVVIPEHVLEAERTHRCSKQEKAKARAVIRAFVETFPTAAEQRRGAA